MKVLLIYIGMAFSAFSCSPKEFRPATGDLLFQVNESSEMTDAITSSTGRNATLNFSHAAIAVRDGSADWVLEASGEGGVRKVTLGDFLASSARIRGGSAVVAMRLRDTSGVAASVARALKCIGQPYDYSYLPGNGKMYCTELIWENYLRPDSSRIFTARPMNFRDADGNLPVFWAELFEQLGEPVPEGVAGTNPNDLSKETAISEVYRWF